MGALVAAGHASHAADGGHPAIGVAIALLIVFVMGVGLGRKRGLKHLSEVQFKSNWAAVRNHKRF